MLYLITRNGQSYGPYTLEDLQKYVASGNVLPTDLAKSDEMTEAAPVWQVLGMPAPQSFQQPQVQAYPGGMPQAVALYPDAPNLSWGLVLLFSFFTCGFFMFIWNLVVSSWMKRVQPNSRAIFYYIAAAVLWILQFIFRPHVQMHFELGWHGIWPSYQAHLVRSILAPIAIWIVRLVARFTLRADLEEHFNTVEPIGLSLNVVMTFFFGGLYFQYHLNRINELKRMARYRGAAI